MKNEIEEIENYYKLAELYQANFISPYVNKHALTGEDKALIADITDLLSREISNELAKDAFLLTVADVSEQVLIMGGLKNATLT